MKPPEQMGGPPEQPEEEPVKDKEGTPEKPESEGMESERKITTPEEAAEMTRQRRKDFGLEEERELTPEETQELEGSTEKLLEDLDQYNLEDYSPEIQDECYWVEQEARMGKDRELAKANLEKLLKVLRGETEKPEK